jgi:hypothetical protein
LPLANLGTEVHGAKIANYSAEPGPQRHAASRRLRERRDPCFLRQTRANAFELYLKSGSARAFAKRHLI